MYTPERLRETDTQPLSSPPPPALHSAGAAQWGGMLVCGWAGPGNSVGCPQPGQLLVLSKSQRDVHCLGAGNAPAVDNTPLGPWGRAKGLILSPASEPRPPPSVTPSPYHLAPECGSWVCTPVSHPTQGSAGLGKNWDWEQASAKRDLLSFPLLLSGVVQAVASPGCVCQLLSA